MVHRPGPRRRLKATVLAAAALGVLSMAFLAGRMATPPESDKHLYPVNLHRSRSDERAVVLTRAELDRYDGAAFRAEMRIPQSGIEWQLRLDDEILASGRIERADNDPAVWPVSIAVPVGALAGNGLHSLVLVDSLGQETSRWTFRVVD